VINSTKTANPEVREIPLTDGLVATVDAEDYESVAGLKWEAKRGPRGEIYAITRFRDAAGKAKFVSMHRYLTAAAPGRLIYHLDRNRLNNSRRTNLRVRPAPSATVKGKRQGRRVKGVTMTPWGTYRVSIRQKYVGSRKTLEEAALLYDSEALKAWGDAAVLNFPDLARASA
jgi:hypothetical protein